MQHAHRFALLLTLTACGLAQSAHAAPCLTYQDNDLDGFGNPAVSSGNCPASGWVTNNTDCNDANFNVNPGVTEIPGDNFDSNCDLQELCYVDSDNDGHRTPGASTITSANSNCNDPGEALASDPADDCNDSNPFIHPGATELPADNTDSDCNGTELCFADSDSDGYRPNSGAVVISGNLTCTGPGNATNATPTGDCNDNNDLINPSATDICDGIDNDCSGVVDDGVACPDAATDAGNDASSNSRSDASSNSGGDASGTGDDASSTTGNDAAIDASSAQGGTPGGGPADATAAGGNAGSGAAMNDASTPGSGGTTNPPVIDASTTVGGAHSTGGTHSAGGTRSGGPQLDASTSTNNAGSSGTTDKSGCTCRVVGQSAPSQSTAGWFTLLLLGLAISRRDRRLRVR